ncbi:MAG TPA: DNA primase [Candidatus Gallacutalibacter stercoravium]|nr:DNA primase [Candidatus Gallacutalibacter stercoravium]
MPLPDSFLQELKARCDITEVVSGYVNLKRRGRNMVGLCPFHGEKTPSFNIYPENGSFYCFGCGVGGDVITFIRRIENLDYIEAVKFLAQRAGLQMPEDGRDQGMSRIRSRIFEANREAARFYHRVLHSPQGEQGLAYLRGRALLPKTIVHFGLGYAPDSRYALVDYLTQKGFSPEELIAANLAFQGKSGRAVDRFAGRVMFPIIDLRGNVVAFGGRILTDAKPKYLNTSDTMVFKKSTNLFALNFAKNTGEKRLILAEGYMDVIALHQAGFPQAVATLGTSLTTEQAQLMARYASQVIICYDSDGAGQKAAARAIPMLREAGVQVRVLTVPGSKDPDEYIRSYGEQGPARFKQLLDSSGNDVEYRLQKVRAQCNMESPDGRVAYITGAVEVLASLESRIEQEIYAGRLSEEVGIEKASVMMQVDKLMRKRRKEASVQQVRQVQRELSGQRDEVNPQRAQFLRAANAEEALIAYVINNQDMAKNIVNSLPPEQFCTDFNRRVYDLVTQRILAGRPVGMVDLSQDLTMEELSRVAKMLSAVAPGSDTPEAAQEYIKVIQYEKEKSVLQNAGSLNDTDLQKQLQLLREKKK